MLSAAHRLLRSCRGRWRAPSRIPMLPGPPLAEGGRSPGGCFLLLRRVRLQGRRETRPLDNGGGGGGGGGLHCSPSLSGLRREVIFYLFFGLQASRRAKTRVGQGREAGWQAALTSLASLQESLELQPPYGDAGRGIEKAKVGARLGKGRCEMLWVRRTGNLRHHRRALYSTLVPPDEVTVHYKHGLPVITLTLPSRKERCQFTIKPMLTTVGNFLQDIKREDNAIEMVEVFTTDGSRISNSVSMEVLLMNDFKLIVNNAEYNVHPPRKDKMSKEHATEIDDIKSTVHKLFVALHLEEHQTRKEKELMQKMELLKEELLPFEEMKARIAADIDGKTSRLLWIGLALMSTQGGALAWLTWWVYSWDIMEPVTYFITYGSAMGFYAYFVLTKQDYIYPDARDRQFLHYFHRKAKSQNFNMILYNKLKEDLEEVEESLKRLRNPLQLQLPVQEINNKH